MRQVWSIVCKKQTLGDTAHTETLVGRYYDRDSLATALCDLMSDSEYGTRKVFRVVSSEEG